MLIFNVSYYTLVRRILLVKSFGNARSLPSTLMKQFSKSRDGIVCYAKYVDDLICHYLTRSNETSERYL